MTEYLLGIDVSDVQGFPKWDRVKNDGVEYAFCKATEGTTFKAKRFKYNWDGIKDAGIIRGTYHFARTKNDPIVEATHFVDTVGEVDDSDMLVLDIEDERNKLSKTDFIQWNLSFLETVEQKTGVVPIVYTGGPYFNKHGGQPDDEIVQKFLKYPLWLAAYTKTPDKYVPYIWKSKGWAIWQRSGDVAAKGDTVLRVDGIYVVVDRNQFDGTREDFLNFAKSLHVKEEEPPVIEPKAWDIMSEVIGKISGDNE